MQKSGILNPALNSLLSRVRHTNTLVIADRGFPFWPQIETIDLSLIDDVPTVMDVLKALKTNYHFGHAYMAEEFRVANSQATQDAFAALLIGVGLTHEPHTEFKMRIPNAIGLIRTGDTTHYANIVLESA